MTSRPVQSPSPQPEPEVPAPPRSTSPWAAASKDAAYLMAIHSCGCPVKVRDAAAGERMRAIACKRHST